MKRAPASRSASSSPSRRPARATSKSSPRPRSPVANPGRVSLTVEQGPHAGLPRAEILRRIRAMIGALQLVDPEVSFVLTDDERIHQLNKIYRGKDRPTDVLAFAMQEGELAELAGSVLGDVIVSVPTARKQAAERKADVIDEVTMLLAHGLLHLLGWDHDTAAKDRRMRAETDRLCQAASPPAKDSSGLPRRSKVGAKQALTVKQATVVRPSRPKKSQAPRQLKARRSRKG